MIDILTGAWYGDRQLPLKVPENWDVSVFSPATPPSLSKEQMNIALQNSAGQEPIDKLCKGKNRPLVIVDDLNRPTPANQIMPILLKYFTNASFSLSEITVLMATGSHGKPAPDAMSKKIGPEAAGSCRLLLHDCFKKTVGLGHTSFGTRVCVNPAVLKSDFVLGIGGVYPNWTAGFGGGTKIVLGVLGLQTIFDLHYRHSSVGWGCTKTDNSFREDLNEISRMIGLRSSISLQINGRREIIRVDCGDPEKYFQEAVNFCSKTFCTSLAKDADIVISNAYPTDTSLTFARTKGFTPLEYCKPTALRIGIAACAEGIGLHNIYPFFNKPRFFRERQLFRLVRAFGMKQSSKKMLKKLRSLSSSKEKQLSEESISRQPLLLFHTGSNLTKLPSNIPGIQQFSKWADLVHWISKEKSPSEQLKVAVYPSASLQFFKSPEFNVSPT